MPPDDARVSSELLLPEFVREDELDVRALFPIVIGETDAESRRHAEHREKLRRYQYRRNLEGFLTEAELRRCVNDRRHSRERFILLRPVEKIDRVDDVTVSSRLEVRLPHLHEPLGLREGEWSQEHAVDDAEYCRARADSEGERRNGDQREERSLDQRAGAVAQIVD